MVFTREEAVRRALGQRRNKPDTCQLWTRTMFGAHSVGDFDGDGSADAEDGWKQSTHKHPGDRNPPRGVPVSYIGGSGDHGHRAISLGNGQIRSTDAPNRGFVGTVDLSWPERAWGLKYVGWSEDISGVVIPQEKPKMTRGKKVDHAIKDLRAAKGQGERRRAIKSALASLLKIKAWKVK